MLSRERKGELYRINKSIPDPGAYFPRIHDDHQRCVGSNWRLCHSMAPFNQSAKRFRDNVKDEGTGLLDVTRKPYTHIKNGKFSQSVRFNYKYNTNPGPNHYCGLPTSSLRPLRGCIKDFAKKKPMKAQLSKIVEHHDKVASIPYIYGKYGYEGNELGYWTPVLAKERRPSLVLLKSKIRNNFLHKNSNFPQAKRFKRVTYFPYVIDDSMTTSHDVYPKSIAHPEVGDKKPITVEPRTDRIPGQIQQEINLAIKENIPGPASYLIKNGLGTTNHTYMSTYMPETRIKSENSPTDYLVPRYPEHIITKLGNYQVNSFNSTDKRFKDIANFTPNEATYVIQSDIDKKLAKSLCHSNLKPPFNTSEARKFRTRGSPLRKPHEYVYPPNYKHTGKLRKNLMQEEAHPKDDQLLLVARNGQVITQDSDKELRSISERCAKRYRNDRKLGPTLYNVDCSEKLTQPFGKSGRRQSPLTTEAKNRQSSFLFKAKRFPVPLKPTVGPGEYTVDRCRCKFRNYEEILPNDIKTTIMTGRSREKTNYSPGPARYYVQLPKKSKSFNYFFHKGQGLPPPVEK
ncbi:hypothetical protein SNEBB_010013 [Seison nebaliae]|nr:hypothetical protein SNEBB_010013 [Seison nebaliae]